MTAINLETQIVGSAYDPATRMCSYTYQHHDGQHYTVEIPLDHLEGRGPVNTNNISINRGNQDRRRKHLVACIQSRLQGAPDRK